MIHIFDGAYILILWNICYKFKRSIRRRITISKMSQILWNFLVNTCYWTNTLKLYFYMWTTAFNTTYIFVLWCIIPYLQNVASDYIDLHIDYVQICCCIYRLMKWAKDFNIRKLSLTNEKLRIFYLGSTYRFNIRLKL